MFYYADQIGCYDSEEEFKIIQNKTIKIIDHLDCFEPNEYRKESLNTLLKKLNITFSNYKTINEIKQNLKINILKKEIDYDEGLKILKYAFNNCIKYDTTIYNLCYEIDKIKSNIFIKHYACMLIKDSYQFKEIDELLKIYIQFYKNNIKE